MHFVRFSTLDFWYFYMLFSFQRFFFYERNIIFDNLMKDIFIIIAKCKLCNVKRTDILLYMDCDSLSSLNASIFSTNFRLAECRRFVFPFKMGVLALTIGCTWQLLINGLNCLSMFLIFIYLSLPLYRFFG